MATKAAQCHCSGPGRACLGDGLLGSLVSPQELWGLGPDFLSNYNCLF